MFAAYLRLLVVFAPLAFFVMAGCNDKHDEAKLSVERQLEEARKANRTDPQFTKQNDPAPDTVVIFIHGIFGDTLDTWKSGNGVRFYDLIANDPEFVKKFDVFVFGFPSDFIGSGSFSISEAAKRLKLHIDDKLRNYQRVVIVAHSMGGLVTMKYLISTPNILSKVPLVVLFSTPQEPVHIASIGTRILGNPGLMQMSELKNNFFYQELEDRWKELDRRTKLICAYELKTTKGYPIVPWGAATRYCEGGSQPIGEDHLGIVKPNRIGHDSYLFLKGLLRTYVVNAPDLGLALNPEQKMEIAKLENLIGNNIARFPSEALKDALALVSRYPEYANGYRLTGVAYWNMGKFEDALAAYATALLKKPDADILFKLQVNETATLLALGRVTESQERIKQLRTKYPNDEIVRILAGLDLLIRSDYRAAQDLFKELDGRSTLPKSEPFIDMALAFATLLAYPNGEHDKESVTRLKRAISSDQRLRRVFEANSRVVIEGWNYSIFRDLVPHFSDRSKINKVLAAIGAKT